MIPEKRIHTTVPQDIAKKILEYGKGTLKDGIINLIKIAESKEITVIIQTEVHV